MNNLQYFSKQIAVGFSLVSVTFASMAEMTEAEIQALIDTRIQEVTSGKNDINKDLFSFPYAIYVDQNKCIPAKATLALSYDENSNSSTNTQNYNIYRPKRNFFGRHLENWVVDDSDCKGKSILSMGEPSVAIPKAKIIEDDASFFGWKYGALIAPYKYYVSSHTVKGSTTIAPYAGWKIDRNSIGFEMAPIIFAGPALIEATDSSGNTSSLFGISLGLGVLFELNDEFNIGALYGYDVVNKSEDFADNGHPWVSLSIGYNLSN